jgi:two-component system cell cycle sensor histidine kinase/response regulator CckA
MYPSQSSQQGHDGHTPLNIVHLEDNLNDRVFVKRALSKAGIVCNLTYATNFHEFDAALSSSCPHLILSDFTLPGYSGTQALAFAQQHCPEVPYIFVSGTIGEERAVDSLKGGATDYVLKNNLSRLPAAVEQATRAARESARRRQAELALHESEKRFREMAENIRDVFWVSSPDGKQLLYVSPGYANIWGRAVADLHAEPGLWASSITEDDRDRVLKSFATLAQGGEVRIEYRITRPDGEVRWVETRAYPSVDSGGVAHAVGVSADITERKLLQHQLLQSQKMEAVGQLAGGIAHDFNNLLTVINGYAELALHDVNIPGDIQKPLQHIRTAGERAATLTRQLLVFSRKQAMNFKPLDLNHTIEESARMLGRLIGEQIDLHLALDPALPKVEADSTMMEQVLMNLVVNARDAMPKGGRLLITTETLKISAAAAKISVGKQAGVFVRLSVSDTGEGITADVLPRIFEPFFTTKGIGKGTGLGLAMVFGIIENHHGWIETESRLGEGTIFRIYLPATCVVAGSGERHSVDEGPAGRGTETILLVEDDDAVRELTLTVLQNYGYTVLTACTGREGLEVWKRHRGSISLLLTDVVMPDAMTGLELARLLRAGDPNLKVICMSGYNQEVMGRQSSAGGSMEFLPKPSSPQTIARLVRHTLDSKIT